MTERTDASAIFRMAAAGSLIAFVISIIGMLSVWIGSEGFGEFADYLTIAPLLLPAIIAVGLLVGVVPMALTGFLIGLLLGRTAPISREIAALAGGVSGLLFIVAVLALTDTGWADLGVEMLGALVLFPSLGAVSGIAARRLVLGAPPAGLYT